jgi:hypothetical protein
MSERMTGMYKAFQQSHKESIKMSRFDLACLDDYILH